MSTFIEFNSTDDLPIKAIQKLNHNFKNINGSETSATVVRIIEDTVTYGSLSDKPTINGVLIIGDVSLDDLGICPVDNDGMVPIDRLPEYYAPKASPALTGTPTAPTAAAGTNTTQIATTAFVQSALGDVAGALVYKGTVGIGGTVTDLPADHTKGWYYIVKAAGTFAGISCEAGDMIICHNTNTTASNSDWDVIQTNIETLTTTEIDALWTAA